MKPKLLSAIIISIMLMPSALAVGEDGATLSITIFTLAVSGTLLFLALNKQQFFRHDILNFVVKRSMLFLSFLFLTMSSALMAEISAFAALGVETEMFLYMQIFGYSGYVTMAYIIVKTIIDVTQLMNDTVQNKRMGGDR